MSFWSRIERRLGEIADDILPDEFRGELDGARKLLDEGKAAEAAELIEGVLAARRDHPGALSLLGAVRLEQGEVAAARAIFDRALKARPDLAEALLGRGGACLSLGELSEAVTSFRAAVDAAAGSREVLAAAYRGLGIAHRRGGELEKAIRELRKAVAEDPKDPIARAHLGEALFARRLYPAASGAAPGAPGAPGKKGGGEVEAGEALFAARITPSYQELSAEEARRHLERSAKSAEAPALAHLVLGRLSLLEGDASSAREAFSRAEERARELGDEAAALEALIGAGDAALAAGDPTGAHPCFLRALELDAESSHAFSRLAEVHSAVGALEQALGCFERALALGAGSEVRRRALDTALGAGDIDAATRLAEPLLGLGEHETRALVARGLSEAAAGAREAAEASYKEALETGEDVEAHLALGRLYLGTDPAGASRAAEEALAALRLQPLEARARELLAEARERELGAGVGKPAEDEAKSERGTYELAAGLHRVCLARPALGALAGEVSSLAADLDRPLLVTIMGEFSSGKSSLVNAFVGHEVAPTGITPTTATINVARHGRERGGRILYRDGRAESLSWEALFPTLQALDAARAREVSVVEILLPLDELERVHIVDTPGLNSILPEHEEVARDFLTRADAVVWLFTAGQAGKASEREALEKIRSQGVRVLGVLNKVDQLEADQVGEVVEHVTRELDGLVEAVLPLSARRAMEHRIGGAGENGSKEPAEDGNFAALSRALEERFFARARELKEQAGSRRLARLLKRARQRAVADRDRAGAAAAALREGADSAAAARDGWGEVVTSERRRLSEEAASLYRSAAREVLELVQPRRLPFGSHSATRADRDYLISLLETGFETALEPSRRRVVEAIREAGEHALGGLGAAAGVVGGDILGDVERTIDDAIRLLEARVFARCQAYLQGYLRGGYVDTFFRRELPKLELNEDAVYHALFRDSPDLDEQIATPLARAGHRALDAIARRLSHLSDVAGVLGFDAEVGALRPVEALEERREGLGA